MQESTKSMKIIAWCLLTPIVLFLLMAGGTKIAGVNPLSSIESMSRWVMWIGLGEITAALLILIPRTSILGAFALSAHLGGAILFHIIRGENLFGASIFTSFWFQSTLLLCVWLVVVLRYPAILTNFK
ncbi:DoxX family protein [Aurantivibrio infirmus]